MSCATVLDNKPVGTMHARPQHLHLHRGPADPGPHIKRQYCFLVIACLFAAHNIIYGTWVLLARLPNGVEQRLLSHTIPSRNLRTPPPNASAASSAAAASCNASASPYALTLRGERHFPALASFMRANTLLLEDLHPGSSWVIAREYMPLAATAPRAAPAPNAQGYQPGQGQGQQLHQQLVPLLPLHNVDWGLSADIASVLPLPAGLMPLFITAPHSPGCSREQVRRHWEAAHAAAADGRPPQQQQQGQQQPHPLRFRPEFAVAEPGGAGGMFMPGMGHPQGLFYRVFLPPLLEPKPAENVAVAEGHDGKGEGAQAEGDWRLARPERELFAADDRFSGGERLFPMRSMTKALVALLCLALQDRGLLSVDDPVHLHLPEWRDGVYGNMTLAMLLTHTAGYDSDRYDKFILPLGDISLRESALRSLHLSKLVGSPGEQFHYTEVGYQVLGAALEAAGGAPFHELLEALVLVPAGLCNTRVFNWWADTRPTRGPLVPDCRTGEEQPTTTSTTAEETAAWSSATRAGSFWRRWTRAPRQEEANAADAEAGGAGGGNAAAGEAEPSGRWSANPSLAIGGVTSASDLNRLLGLLANGGRAACCGAAIAAPADGPPAGTTRGSAADPATVQHTQARRDKAASASSASKGNKNSGSGGSSSRRYCRCGARVVSERGIAAMLSRQRTPGLEQSMLVRSFMMATPLTVQLLADMGLMTAEAVAAFRAQTWGGFGYGFGLWLIRNSVTGADGAWMFGAFNTVAGLVPLTGNSSAGGVSRGGGGADGAGGGGRQQRFGEGLGLGGSKGVVADNGDGEEA